MFCCLRTGSDSYRAEAVNASLSLRTRDHGVAAMRALIAIVVAAIAVTGGLALDAEGGAFAAVPACAGSRQLLSQSIALPAGPPVVAHVATHTT